MLWSLQGLCNVRTALITEAIPLKTSLYGNSSKQRHNFVPSQKNPRVPEGSFTRQEEFHLALARWLKLASLKRLSHLLKLWKLQKQARRCCALGLDLALAEQALVELAELPQEAVVGADLALLAHGAERAAHVHAPPQHQVGDDQRGRAAVALPAVHQHLACRETATGMTDFVLLAHGYGCQDFEGMCCLNLSSLSESIHASSQKLRE